MLWPVCVSSGIVGGLYTPIASTGVYFYDTIRRQPAPSARGVWKTIAVSKAEANHANAIATLEMWGRGIVAAILPINSLEHRLETLDAGGVGHLLPGRHPVA